MKKNHRVSFIVRTLALFLLICMLVPVFAACKDEQNDPDEETSAQTDAPDTQDPSGDSEDPENPGDEEDVEIPSKLALETAHGFSRKGRVLSMNIASEDSVLDLDKRFSARIGAKCVLSYDEEGEDEIEGKTLVLKEGENVFYVTVKFGKDSFTYKAVVDYIYAIALEFYSNCDDFIATQAVTLGDKAVRPEDPTRDGYTFLGWYLDGKEFDFDTPPAKSGTVIAHWDKNDKSLNSYYTSCTEGMEAVRFTDISAGLRVVWKDYANAGGVRPEGVTCVLTQTYGNTVNTYDITVCKDFATWSDPDNTPGGSTVIDQGEGGDWTLSIRNLPEKVGSYTCEYTLVQQKLKGDYSTLQAGSAAYNTLKGYVASIDDTAKLTVRNARFYDASGNQIVFNGVVTGNVGWARLLWDTEPDCLKQLTAIGCNVIRTTVPIIATEDNGHAWVYWAVDGLYRTARTGAYAKGQPEVDQPAKDKVMEAISLMIDRATEEGLYIIVNWPILTSNPYEYIDEAKDFFGQLSKKYADNPYVLYEICNEPASCYWSDTPKNTTTNGKGIKSYAEEIIDVIRGNGSDGVIIVAPRASANYVSMSPAAYNRQSDINNEYVGDDPISDPLDDDRRYNVAYTHHAYPYMNQFEESTNNGRDAISWRFRDAYDAGLALVITEMSPMDAKLDRAYPIGYDFESMDKYMRMFEEYDIGFCYFKYLTVARSAKPAENNGHDEWYFFRPGVDPRKKVWNASDLTECGKWYYYYLTGDAMFVRDVDYDATYKEGIRKEYESTFEAYGLKGDDKFTVYPGFAYRGVMVGTKHYFRVGDEDTLSDVIYQRYCQFIFKKILAVCASGTAKQMNGQAFDWANVPATKAQSMQLTYQYGSKTCTVNISYGQYNGSYGVFVEIK